MMEIYALQLVENANHSRLSKEIADMTHRLRYIYIHIQCDFLQKSLIHAEMCCIFRQMRGEDLQGMSIEELQQLERSLETGLSRVIEKKVQTLILYFGGCLATWHIFLV